MLISRVLKYTRRVITPLVSGIVVTLIGMSLIKVGISACGGGAAAQADGTFGAFRHIGLAALVLVLIIFFNRSSNRYLRMSSIVIGLVVGYVLAWALEMVDFSAVQSYGGFNIPIPFRYGISFDISAIIALALVYLITAIEAYGDITANSLISGEPVEGETFVKRASGGILADGFNSMLAGFFNSFPNSIFAQNNGMIQLTGVASRYVGYFIAGFLILLGLFPAVGLIFSLMPEPVLGGATLLMFGTVAAAGIRIISAQKINRKATLVMALSFSFGLSVELVPDILCQLPEPFAHRFGIPCEPAYNPAEDIEFQLELRGIPVLPVQHVPVLEVTFGQCHEIPAGLALAALRWYRMFIAAVQLLHIREKIPAAVLRQPRSAIIPAVPYHVSPVYF